MSEAEKPTNEPEQQPAREGRPSPRNRPKRERPDPGNAGKVPSLDERDLGYATGSRITAFNAEIANELERDLQETMGGLSDADMKQLYGEAPRGKQAQQSGSMPRKGKVMSVRGKDVFIDVGGRIQGVLPVSQFDEGPPEIGTEAEVSSEGHDPDGLLIL